MLPRMAVLTLPCPKAEGVKRITALSVPCGEGQGEFRKTLPAASLALNSAAMRQSA